MDAEKQVHTCIVADGVEDVINFKKLGRSRTLILITGNSVLLPLVKKALEHGYTVEIWSFSTSMSKEFVRLANQTNKVKIRYIDSIVSEVGVTQIIWSGDSFPLDKSIVAR